MTNFEQQAAARVQARENATRQQQIDAERTALEQQASEQRNKVVQAFNLRRNEAFGFLQTTRAGYQRRAAITDEIARLTAELVSIDRSQQETLTKASRLIQGAGFDVLQANGGAERILEDIKQRAGIPVNHAAPLHRPVGNVQTLAAGYTFLIASGILQSLDAERPTVLLNVGGGFPVPLA